MRDYATVSPKFWIGKTGKLLRAAGPECQVVAFYLMTCPHANMLGLYYLPIAYIAHETGLTIEGARKGLRGAIKADFCAYDEATEVVWVCQMARYQVAERLEPKDNRAKGVQNAYDALPENPFLTLFFKRYGEAFCMERRRGEAPNELGLESPFDATSRLLQSQEQEQEQDKDQEQEYPSQERGKVLAIGRGAVVERLGVAQSQAELADAVRPGRLDQNERVDVGALSDAVDARNCVAGTQPPPTSRKSILARSEADCRGVANATGLAEKKVEIEV